MSYSVRTHADPGKEPGRPRPADKSQQSSAGSASQRIQIEQVVQRRTAKATAEGAASFGGASGLPARLRAGIEALSGLAMGDVRVHRNSAEPAKVGALAYTKGTDIHLGPGQEQHLPHEAWHVVQQKQGRVKATAQMKGVAINDDAGLEAEADRMAGSVESPIGTERRTPSYTPGGKSDVIQRKVAFKGKPFGDPGVSATLSKLCASPQEFFLRDDWEPAHSTIHILESKKYLLGEDHSKGRLPEDTQFWTFIPRLLESLPAIPGTNAYYARNVFRDKDGNPATLKETDKPLEGSHVHMLNILILSHEILNDMYSEKERDSNRVINLGRDLIGYLDSVPFLMGEYNWFCSLPSIKSSKLPHFSLLRDFSAKLSSTYIKPVLAIQLVTSSLIEELERPGWNSPDEIKVRAFYTLLADYRKVIPLMIAEMTKIVGLKEGGVEENRVKAVTASSEPDQEQAADAIRVTREVRMAWAVKGHKPPVFVQVGDNHVDGIEKYASDRTIVKLHLGDELEDITGRPK